MKVYPILFALILVSMAGGAVAPTGPVTEPKTAMLVPNANDAPNAWTPTGCTNAWQCLNTDDGNTSYIRGAPGAGVNLIAQFAMQDLTANNVVSIDNVTFFAWDLSEGTPYLYTFGYYLGSGACTLSVSPVLSRMYGNSSTAALTTDCGGNAWTVSLVNELSMTVSCRDDNIAPPENACRVTMLAMTVTYETYTTLSIQSSEWTLWLFTIIMIVLTLIGLVFSLWPSLILSGFMWIFWGIITWSILLDPYRVVTMVIGIAFGLILFIYAVIRLMVGD